MSVAPSMRAFSNSHGSRTSRSTGGSRPASFSHAASSVGRIGFISEPKALRLFGVHQPADYRFEEVHAAAGTRREARHEARLHRRGLAHHGEEAPARIERVDERL